MKERRRRINKKIRRTNARSKRKTASFSNWTVMLSHLSLAMLI